MRDTVDMRTCQTCGSEPGYMPPATGATASCPECGARVLLSPKRSTPCTCDFCREWPRDDWPKPSRRFVYARD